MKRALILLALIAALISLGTVSVQALMRPGLGGSTGGTPITLVTVDSGKNDPSYPHIKKLILLEEEEALDVCQLPAGLFYLDADNNTHGVEILWDLTSPTLAEPGLHTVTGVPDPAKLAARNLALADGFDGTVTWPVWRQGGDEPLTVSLAETNPVERPLIALGGDPAALEINPFRWNFSVGSDGFTKPDLTWQWSWDFSGVDTSTSGRYTAIGRLTQPDWISLPDDNTVSFPVYVMPADRIELTAPLSTSAQGWLEFQWLYPAEQVSAVVLEQKTEAGDWIPCDPSWYTYRTPTQYLAATLRLQLLALPTDVPLTLRLRYQDDTVERLTEPITITLPENIDELLPQANGRIPDELILGGDRDGSDSSGSKLPDIEQFLPLPTLSPNPFAAPNLLTLLMLRKEIVTDTYTAISGLRLRRLLEQGKTVLFEKEGVAAELPSACLAALRLGYYDMLKVTIRRPAEDRIQLAVTGNDRTVETLTGTVVRLPWDSKPDTALVCRDINGITVSDAVWEPESQTLRFTIDTPGTYLLAAAES